jgi:hypothetical protein
MKPLLIFMHLPKTGGSTLAQIIERQYGSRSVLPLYKSTSGEELASLPQDWMADIQAITGHFHFGVHELLSTPSIYITMLRDPLERVISHYYYVRNHRDHYLHPMATECGLSEFVQVCNLQEPNNDQTRLLGADPDSIRSGQCSPELLARAKDRLQHHFAVVGITEAFDQSLILMKKRMGWRTPYYSRENVTRKRPMKEDFSRHTLQVVRTYNELDCELYRFGKQLLDDQVHLLDDAFEQEVHRFKVANALLGRLSIPRGFMDRFHRIKTG